MGEEMAPIQADDQLWAAAGILAELNADVIELLAANDLEAEISENSKLQEFQSKIAKLVNYLQRNQVLPRTPFVESADHSMRAHMTGNLDSRGIKELARAIGWMQAVIQAHLLSVDRTDRPASIAWTEHERTWHENALLATLTEKFYGSFAFKAATAALIFIILFAVTGTII